MDKQKILLVCTHEAKLLRRSVLFWILCSLSVVGITLVQWLVQCLQTNSWLMSWQAFSLPLANAYLYNIVQAFILVFITIEIFMRSQKRDSLEALNARPVGNGELLLGKALGVIYVFIGVGISTIICCVGLHLLWSDAPFQASYYLFYFLTLTFPSLIFFTGLSLWLSWMIRSRLVTIALLLGFLYCSVSVLSHVWHGVFDFTGSGLSNLFSAAMGHIDGGNYALHRCGYLMIGIGLILWTVYLEHRLPNRRKEIVYLTTGGAGLMLIGILLIGVMGYGYLTEDRVRDTYREAFARHTKEGESRVTEHNITFTQQGNRIASTSEITLRNPNRETIDRLVLYLNPGLTIESVKEDGKALPFERDEQVVVIQRQLSAGDSVEIHMCYSGNIDERLAYLEIDDATYHDTRRGNSFFHLGRRHALVSDDALVLIPEVVWYPMAVAPVNSEFPALTKREYTRFRLQVVKPIHKVILSQGERRQQGDTVEFSPSRPLEGLTLCGGDYKYTTIDLTGLPLDVYYFEGNDFLSPLLGNTDIKELTKTIRQKIERDLEGAFHIGSVERLTFVETPLPFVALTRTWKGRSERIQPGMMLFSERLLEVGQYFSPATFKRYGWRDDGSVEYALQATLLTQPFFKKIRKTYIQNPFLKSMRLYEDNTDGFDELNTHDCSPLFTDPALTVTSERHGAIDRILKLIAAQYTRFDQGMDMLDYNDIAALTYLQEHTLEEALRSREVTPMVLERLFEFKAKDLLTRTEMRVEREDFLKVLNNFFAIRQGEVPLDTLSAELQTDLGLAFDTLLTEWSSKELPCYRVRDLKVEAYPEKGSHIADFYIQNTGKVTGIVSCIFLRENREILVLAPGDCKRVRVVGHSPHFTLNVGLSGNFPTRINLISNNKLNPDTTLGMWDVSPEIFERKGEIVVDNEDEGFRLITPPTKLLQHYLTRVPRYADGFYGMAPEMGRWSKIHSGSCHGEYIRNAYIKTEGTGSFKAEWTADIPEDGTYEVFAWGANVWSTNAYSYTVSGEGMNEQEVNLSLRSKEWNSLGTFDLKRGKSWVILSDRVSQEEKNEQPTGQNRRMAMKGKPRIVADAVKWVRID